MTKVRKPLRRSIFLVTTIFICILSAMMAGIVFFTMSKMIHDGYASNIEGLLHYVEVQIDVDDLEQCMDTGVESQKFAKLQEELDTIREYTNIHYIYVIVPLNTDDRDNILNVIEGNTKEEYEQNDVVHLNELSGDAYSSESAKKYLDAYNSGELSFFEEKSKWGEDFTGLLPLHNSKGEIVAALCIDEDVHEIHHELILRVIEVVFFVAVIGFVFIVFFLEWTRKNVTGPIELLEEGAVEYASKCRNNKVSEDLKINVPNIHTGNEVESLSDAVVEISEAIHDYVTRMVSVERAAYSRMVSVERAAYSRISALNGDFLCVYIVDPETDDYSEYSASEAFEDFGIPKSGDDFFEQSRENGRILVCPEDKDRFLTFFNREAIISEIKKNGIFSMRYRLMVEGEQVYIQLKAALVEEEQGQRIIVGVYNINSHVKQEEEYERQLRQAQNKASIDALTGVKNKFLFMDYEEDINKQIDRDENPEFAVVVLDLNNLKKVNDEQGHKAGDKYLCDASDIICSIFSHSPVFRIGGDEFAVIARGQDYKQIDNLVGKMAEHNKKAVEEGGIVIACGMAKLEDDNSFNRVFERADQNMYENKKRLKGQ